MGGWHGWTCAPGFYGDLLIYTNTHEGGQIKWWVIEKLDGFSKYGLSFIKSKTFSGNVTQVLLQKSMVEKTSMSIIITSQTLTISPSSKNPRILSPSIPCGMKLSRSAGSFLFSHINPHISYRGSIYRYNPIAILKYTQLQPGSN